MDFLNHFCRLKLSPNRFVTGRKFQTVDSSSRASSTRSTILKRCTRICEFNWKFSHFHELLNFPPNVMTRERFCSHKKSWLCHQLTRDQISFSSFHFVQWKIILRASLLLAIVEKFGWIAIKTFQIQVDNAIEYYKNAATRLRRVPLRQQKRDGNRSSSFSSPR